ncbi:MAG: GMC oxidoreductase [Gemmataceae bacterium]
MKAACNDVGDPGVRRWDVIVIGTGMGGATIGLALARAGLRVLFLEKGLRQSSATLRGDFAESYLAPTAVPGPGDTPLLARAGRWSDDIDDRSHRPHRFVPFVGCGSGGSSALFGAALERLHPADLEPRRFWNGTAGSTLPARWPVRFEELVPYYEDAERLFGLHGTHDPLRGDRAILGTPETSLSPANLKLIAELASRGLHPYRLPLAHKDDPACVGCQGYLCAAGCKRDAGSVCLEPALQHHRAELLDHCDVIRLEADHHAVTGVVCAWRERLLTLKASLIVLAAGALASPWLLLNSASRHWPRGLANRSGLVGRNLMRHMVDLYAVGVPEACPQHNLKQIAFNDFYFDTEHGQKWGTVQSFGNLPPARLLALGLEKELRDKGRPVAAWLARLGRPVLRRVLDRMLADRLILASILEDLPYLDNRIELRSERDFFGRRRLALRYRLPEVACERVGRFRRRLREVLKPLPVRLIEQADNNERLAHVCGTCRFGHDPRTSVLDAGCRAHGLANLYVVDASFFPSSGGTNPGLTIAANALRVADLLLQRRRGVVKLLTRTQTLQLTGVVP